MSEPETFQHELVADTSTSQKDTSKLALKLNEKASLSVKMKPQHQKKTKPTKPKDETLPPIVGGMKMPFTFKDCASLWSKPPKSALCEFCQQNKLQLPSFDRIVPNPRLQQFLTKCTVTDFNQNEVIVYPDFYSPNIKDAENNSSILALLYYFKNVTTPEDLIERCHRNKETKKYLNQQARQNKPMKMSAYRNRQYTSVPPPSGLYPSTTSANINQPLSHPPSQIPVLYPTQIPYNYYAAYYGNLYDYSSSSSYSSDPYYHYYGSHESDRHHDDSNHDY
eukprot:TRINITY_DN11609_c0_g1_i1.p1 TRINITY_DN11609_c0_g1~~TRINITY_DN11609_c0_g1_i1.p1  ORF type:complete len:279 (-),score=41.72 TRINITY_DN11609_c0_g1_i1:184-1020(-)